MRVLIAEDETLIRLDLRLLLESASHEVCAEAKDGLEAVALAETACADIAVLDVKMPGLDGIEAAQAVTPTAKRAAALGEDGVARAVDDEWADGLGRWCLSWKHTQCLCSA